MGVRSQTLIHWTRPEGQSEADHCIPNDNYINHIKCIYSEGLRFSVPKTVDIVHGVRGAVSKIPNLPIICYSELRLSDVSEHVKRYGRMGIGFKRDWLMHERGANPVFYVQNTGEGIVGTNLAPIVSSLKDNGSNPLRMVLSFVKPISDYDNPSHEYYEEMEWRMVLWNQFFLDGIPQADPPWLRRGIPYSHFKFLPNEVEKIYVPNEEIRKALLNDENMAGTKIEVVSP